MKTNRIRKQSLLVGSLASLLLGYLSVPSAGAADVVDVAKRPAIEQSTPTGSEPCSPSAAAKELYQVLQLSLGREFEVSQHIGSLEEDVREKIASLRTTSPSEHQNYLKRFQTISDRIDAARLDRTTLCQIEAAFGPIEMNRYLAEAKADAHKPAADEKFIQVLKSAFDNMSATIKSAALELADIQRNFSSAPSVDSDTKTNAPSAPLVQADSIELQRAWCDGNRSNVPGKEGLAIPALRAKGCTAIIQAKDEPIKSRAMAYYKRGVAYNGMFEDALALADFNEAVRLDPANPQAFYERGFIHHRNDEQDLAIADFTSAIHLDPKYASAYYGRGGAYTSKGLYKKAIDDFNRAIKLEPTFADAFNGRGVVYRNMQQDRRAQADFDHATRLQKERAAAKCAEHKAKAESC